jgi:hypothetical protein
VRTSVYQKTEKKRSQYLTRQKAWFINKFFYEAIQFLKKNYVSVQDRYEFLGIILFDLSVRNITKPDRSFTSNNF